MKEKLLEYQNLDKLPSYQHLIAGGLSGAMGPMSNAPIDTIKTRIQKVSLFHNLESFHRAASPRPIPARMAGNVSAMFSPQFFAKRAGVRSTRG